MFLNGYSPENINSIVPGGWSIAVEVNFYLIFPALLAITNSLARSIILIAATLGLSETAQRVFSFVFADSFSLDQSYIVRDFQFLNFFHQLPVFAVGITAYFILSNAKFSRAAAIISVATLFGLAVLMGLFRAEMTRYVHDYLLLVASIFAMLAIALNTFPLKILVTRPIQYIGRISFSLYLSHFAVLFYFEKCQLKSAFPQGNLSSLVYFTIVLVSGCVIAALFHVCIERPGVRMGNVVIRHLETRRIRNPD